MRSLHCSETCRAPGYAVSLYTVLVFRGIALPAAPSPSTSSYRKLDFVSSNLFDFLSAPAKPLVFLGLCHGCICRRHCLESSRRGGGGCRCFESRGVKRVASRGTQTRNTPTAVGPEHTFYLLAITLAVGSQNAAVDHWAYPTCSAPTQADTQSSRHHLTSSEQRTASSSSMAGLS